MKKIFILNGTGTVGKGEFATAVGKHIASFKYSSVDLVKTMLKVAGVEEEPKTEEKRLLCSDLKDRLTQYDDIPFKDITSIVTDFKNDLIDTDVLFIDIREPEEIARAVKVFGAKTILIRNPNVVKIESNHADRDVENYIYDYIIENDGTLEQLNSVAKMFAKELIKENGLLLQGVTFDKKGDKVTTIIKCSKY